jgi:hypothetical protein
MAAVRNFSLAFGFIAATNESLKGGVEFGMLI